MAERFLEAFALFLRAGNMIFEDSSTARGFEAVELKVEGLVMR
jgi:hypothetical protein